MRSGFFNSEIIGYDAENMPVFDRAEEASFFAKYFSQFISNGVFPNPSTNMQVLVTEGMQVKVDIGVCYINGYMGWVEPSEILEIEESDTRVRIDRIVARLDFTDRSINLFVKKGTASGNPVAPELQRDYDIYEIGLADIRVNANVVEITQENVTDLRLNTELCGMVANHLQHLDTTTLFNQYQDWLNRVTSEAEIDLAEKKQEIEIKFNKLMSELSESFDNFISNCSTNFDEWFKDVQTTLSEDVGGNLLVKINNLQDNVNTKYNSTNERIANLEAKHTGHIYGVKRNIESSDPAWERIEDSIGLVANATHDGTEVENDFDNIYPWSDIISYNYDVKGQKITAFYGEPTFKFDGSNGQVMTRIPAFWYKREQKVEEDGNTYEYIYIADYAVNGFIKSEQFSVGRYTISGDSSKVYSKSGVEPFTNYTITNARDYAKSLGSEFGILDWRCFLLQLLYLVEYADYNSQNMLGQGRTGRNNHCANNSGGCDSLGMKSGCLGNDGTYSLIYRGIEDIFGNIWQFIDGINIKEYQAYICYDSSQYAVDTFDGAYQKLGYINARKNGYASKLGYDKNHPLISLATETEGSSDTYTTDFQSISSTVNEDVSEGKIICWGFDWRYAIYSGLWSWKLNGGSSIIGEEAGARLLKNS